MFTSTARSDGALPEMPETVTGDSTVDRSEMVTPSVFSKRSPGGGGVVPPSPTYSRRLGEPLPGLPTTPLVAAEVSAVETCAGLAEGLSARYRAAAPATCGLAMEVPEMVLVAVSLVRQAEVMEEPGANRSSTEP